MPGKARRKLTVTSCGKIYEGTDKNRKPYTIYEIFAVDDGGVPVEAKLRSFSQLTLNELVEYDIEEFRSERHGVSYTLSLPGSGGGKGGPRSSGLGASVDDLRDRVEKLERQLADLLAGRNSGSQSGPTADPPAAPSPALATDHIPQ